MTINNHLTFNEHCRRIHRKLSWCLVGRDVVVLAISCLIAGLLLGFGLIVAWGWL